jgi:hypothetical protein
MVTDLKMRSPLYFNIHLLQAFRETNELVSGFKIKREMISSVTENYFGHEGWININKII